MANCAEQTWDTTGMIGRHRPCRREAKAGSQYCALHAAKHAAKDAPRVIWYRITRWGDGISEEEFAGETEQMLIFPNGQRTKKHDPYYSHFKTREEAKRELIARAEAEVAKFKSQLSAAEDRLARLKEMLPPKNLPHWG